MSAHVLKSFLKSFASMKGRTANPRPIASTVVALVTVVVTLLATSDARAAGASLELLRAFHASLPHTPTAVVRDSGGMFYATLSFGGPTNNGALVKMTAQGVVTPLHYFSESDGGAPTSLLLASDGNLYGTTSTAGDVFKADRNGAFEVIYRGTRSNWLLQASDGNLYGSATQSAGSSDSQLFRLTLSGVYTSLRTFNPNEVSSLSRPMQADNGLLYFINGSSLCHVALDGTGLVCRPHGIRAVLQSRAVLVQGEDGLIYGAIPGLVGDSSPTVPGMDFVATLDCTVSATFESPSTFSNPVPNGDILEAPSEGAYVLAGTSIRRIASSGIQPVVSGLPYPSTRGRSQGFIAVDGSAFTLFSDNEVLTASSNQTELIHKFTGGSSPSGAMSLIRGVDGQFYGMSASSGADGGGTVFRMSIDGAVTVLASLPSPPRLSSLIQGTDGALYGILSSSLFKLTTAGHLTIVAERPGALLAVDGSNTLYWSLSSDAGDSIRKMDPGGTVTTVATLTDQRPSQLVTGADGTIYGMSSLRSDPTSGTLFSIGAAGFVTRFQFTGILPTSLRLGPDGNFYGDGLGGIGVWYFRFVPRTNAVSVRPTASEWLWIIYGTPGPNGSYTATGDLYKVTFDGPRAQVWDFAYPQSAEGVVWGGGRTLLVTVLTYGRDTSSYAVYKLTLPTIAGVTRSDFSGDGRTDVAVYRPSTNVWTVGNTSNGLHSTSVQLGDPGDVPVTADFNGDGATDPAVYRASTGQWFYKVILQDPANAPLQSFQWGAPGDLPLTGYFDDDGVTDAAVYRPTTGQWFIRHSTTAWNPNQYGYFAWGSPGDVPLPADFDGDGLADIVVYRPSRGQWFILYSTRGYDDRRFGVFEWGAEGDVPLVTDFDGDGKADLTVYRPSTGYWYVRHSSTGYPVGAGNWVFQWGLTGDRPQAADFDGDGRTDLAVYRPSTSQWLVRYSSSNYDAGQATVWNFGSPGDIAVPRSEQWLVARPPADLVAVRTGPNTALLTWTSMSGAVSYTVRRGSSKTDLTEIATGITTASFADSVTPGRLYYYSVTATYAAGTSEASAFALLKMTPPAPASDANGDGRSELTIFRPSSSAWLVKDTVTATVRSFIWGAEGDVPLAADFDGDGKLDVTLYRPSTGEWLAQESSHGYQYSFWMPWGAPGDQPLAADFDGDGKADHVRYRAATGTWYVRLSSVGYQPFVGDTYQGDLVFEWGASGDRPLVGDFDGDGKTDVTVYRPSTGEWFIRYSSRGFSSSAFGYFQWGAADDVTVQADYDGDGATDVGVYRPSTGYWYLRYSSEAFVAGSTSHPWTFLLGGPGLAPHARDIDGDGRTDMTVVGSPVMNWHFIPSPFGSSPAGVFLGVFGATGDVVLP